MPATFTRDRFTWLMYLMLAFYAYFINVIGPITPFLKDELKLSYTVSSLHYTAFALGILLVGLGGHWVIARLGRWWALWTGAFGISVGVVLLMLGRTPAVTIGAALAMGLVGSLILAIVPSALADRHGEQRAIAISEANVLSSLVSTAAPLLVGWFAGIAGLAGGWRVGLAIVAFVPLVMRFFFGRAAFEQADRAVSNGGQPVPAEGSLVPSKAPLPMRYWVYWVALVLAVAVEFCMISWSADYMENGLGMAKASAAQAVSLFLAGMIIGRLASSRLVQRFSAHKLVMASALLAGIGFMLYWLARSPLPGMVGLFITGLGVASLYPLILSLAIGAAGEKTVQAGARATLASGTAILSLPLVLGRLADAVGIRPAYGVVLALLVSVFLIVQLTTRRAHPAMKEKAA